MLISFAHCLALFSTIGCCCCWLGSCFSGTLHPTIQLTLRWLRRSDQAQLELVNLLTACCTSFPLNYGNYGNYCIPILGTSLYLEESTFQPATAIKISDQDMDEACGETHHQKAAARHCSIPNRDNDANLVKEMQHKSR